MSTNCQVPLVKLKFDENDHVLEVEMDNWNGRDCIVPYTITLQR